MLRGEERS